MPDMHPLYKFHNRNASSVRALLVANVPWLEPKRTEFDLADRADSDADDDEDRVEFRVDDLMENQQDFDIQHSSTFYTQFGQQSTSNEATLKQNADQDDDLTARCAKYLIFLNGSSTYSPHQIAFKYIDSTVNMADLRHHEHYDRADIVLNLHGHIIGMALSPDHRLLYVNTRSWPTGYVISDVLQPPPIAQEVDLHVIDMRTLQPVGQLRSAHKAFTSNTECFFLFPSVCDDYVAR